MPLPYHQIPALLLSAMQQKVRETFRLEELSGLDLYGMSIAELQEQFSGGQVTSVEYVRFCLDCVYKVNSYFECVIEVNSDAVDIAAALDEERKKACEFPLGTCLMRTEICHEIPLSVSCFRWESPIPVYSQGKARSVLHGIPVLVKDNMVTKDKTQTTAGSWALLGSVVSVQSNRFSSSKPSGGVKCALYMFPSPFSFNFLGQVTERLTQRPSRSQEMPMWFHFCAAQGPSIIGHTNMSEWASVRSSPESTGYCPRGG